jgi:prophage regulatory protein
MKDKDLSNTHHLSDTYLKRQQLEAKFDVSRATIYRWTKAGNFPCGIRLGENMVRWKVSEIEAWLEEKEAV